MQSAGAPGRARYDAVKDIVPLCVSVAALAVSLAAAFFQFFWVAPRLDMAISEMRVEWEETDPAGVTSHETRGKKQVASRDVSVSLYLDLINSGNRQLLVRKVSMTLYPTTSPDLHCPPEEVEGWETSSAAQTAGDDAGKPTALEPLLLKENELMSRKVSFRSKIALYEDETGMTACLEVETVTPAGETDPRKLFAFVLLPAGASAEADKELGDYSRYVHSGTSYVGAPAEDANKKGLAGTDVYRYVFDRSLRSVL